MKAKLYLLLLVVFVFTGCITQKVGETELFNPIKEFELIPDFTFNKKLLVKNDSIEIETWYLTKPNAEFNLIYISGNGSNIRSAIPFFNEIGKQSNLNIFSFNYSGYGLSTGTPSVEGIVSDAELALQHFSEIKENDLPTLILGYSLGGFVALQISHLKIIDNVVIMSTFSSAEELESYLKKEALPKIVRPFLNLEVDEKLYTLNNINEIAELEKPLLILHGEKDDFIPPSMGKRLFDLSKSQQKYFVEIKGADHRTILKDKDKSSIAATEIIQFIRSNQLVSK
jgi:uncharacterized protein